MGGTALPCPAGTYGPKEGLQRLKDCTICPAGRVLTVVNLLNCVKLLKTKMFAVTSVDMCLPICHFKLPNHIFIICPEEPFLLTYL